MVIGFLYVKYGTALGFCSMYLLYESTKLYMECSAPHWRQGGSAGIVVWYVRGIVV